MPWRRVYGSAQNRHLLDRGFLLGSAAVLLVWIIKPLDVSNFKALLEGLESDWLIVGYLAVGILYATGETERRDLPARLPNLEPLQWPLFGAGVALFIVWLWLDALSIVANLESIFSDAIFVISASAVALVAVALMVVWQARRDKKSGKPTIVRHMKSAWFCYQVQTVQFT